MTVLTRGQSARRREIYYRARGEIQDDESWIVVDTMDCLGMLRLRDIGDGFVFHSIDPIYPTFSYTKNFEYTMYLETVQQSGKLSSIKSLILYT